MAGLREFIIMLEKMLSSRGFKLYFGVFLVMFCFVMWNRFTSTGIVAWLDRIQASQLFSGDYYPKLSVLILVIPIVFICFGVGLLHDFAFGLGIFSTGKAPNQSDAK
jgi:hypothetical protein